MKQASASRRAGSLIAITIAAILGQGGEAAAQSSLKHFDIAGQPLSKALTEFARQSDRQILFSEEVAARETQGIKGELEPEVALRRLLKGTGLTFRVISNNTILVESPGARERAAVPGPEKLIRLAQADEVADQPGEPNNPAIEASPTSNQQPPGKEALEEVVVTGTHIRRGESVSAVLVFSQADFDKAGAATAQQFLATLPQNFGGGRSDDTSNHLNLQQFDPSYGASANLRGLGTSSTLVLVNGKRSAVSGSAEYVDLSLIPLSAVERVEVLLDGASATYGSDAVGGVINFIMRENYEGADTSLRYGLTSRGDAAQYHFSQSMGTGWSSGNALATYEFYKQDELSTTERSFSANTQSALDGPRDLQPAQSRHALYATVHQALTDRIRLGADALYAYRDTEYTDWDTFGLEFIYSSSENERYGGSVSLTFDLSDTWTADLVANGSVAETTLVTDTEQTHNFGLGPITIASYYRLSSLEAKLSGGLFALPAGLVRLAIGGGYRDESFEFSQGTDSLVFIPHTESSFSSKSLFSELIVPILGPANPQGSHPRLFVTLAGRYEDYSDFGSTFDPKVGIKWAPNHAFGVRGTYGTSFKAPSVYQLAEFNVTHFVQDVPDTLTPGEMVRGVVRTGNNADLHEETATTWTLGIDLNPRALPGLRNRLTYFSTKYEDRIGRQGVGTAALFNDPLYENLVIRRGEIPDADFNALVAQLLSGRHRISGCSVPLEPITGACAEPIAGINAIIDGRLNNVASLEVSGVDWISSYEWGSRLGSFEAELNVSYLTEFAQRIVPRAPKQSLVDTLGNPARLRGRGSLTWREGDWSATLAVNHTGSYSNRGATDINTGLPLPPATISAWTTVDLNLQYSRPVGTYGGVLSGISASLSIANLFDKEPPYYDDNLYGLGYDPANADPLGRWMSLTIRKSW